MSGKQRDTDAINKLVAQDNQTRIVVIKTPQVSEQLLRVMDQVRIIKESTQATNGLLMDRIEDAFSDIQR